MLTFPSDLFSSFAENFKLKELSNKHRLTTHSSGEEPIEGTQITLEIFEEKKRKGWKESTFL